MIGLICCLILSPMMGASSEDWMKLASDASAAEAQGQLQEAKQLLDTAVQMEPKQATLYSRRGGVHFKLGMIKESLADFDQQIGLKPNDAAAHWRRGLTLYYAQKYSVGVAQFITSDKAEPEDVENAVWHLLCNARAKGVEAARKESLKVSKDSRVPMMEVYELFVGRSTEDKVMAKAEEGQASESERRSRRFYAHLYCGLFEEMMGNGEKSLALISKAVKDYPIEHYMMDVARVHVKLRSK